MHGRKIDGSFISILLFVGDDDDDDDTVAFDWMNDAGRLADERLEFRMTI
jgi:trehalose-6-phosphatase